MREGNQVRAGETYAWVEAAALQPAPLTDRMAPMNSGRAYTGPERRESPRYKVNFRARWAGGEREGREGTINELSSGGCFVLTDDVVEEGQLVELEIEMPGQKALTLWGNVAYWVAETGFAVRFPPFAQDGARQRLELLLRHVAE